MRGLYTNIIASSRQAGGPPPTGISFDDMTHICGPNTSFGPTTPFNAPLPSTAVEGDLVVYFIESDMLYTSQYLVPPGDWTLQFSWYGSTSDNAGILLTKVVTASDVSTGHISIYAVTNVTRDIQAWSWIANGVDKTTPISDVGVWTQSEGVSKTIAGITPSANGLAVAFWGFDGGDGEPTTITSGWTKLEEIECDGSTSGTFAGFASKTSTSGVGTGNITVTALVSDGWGGVMVNFKQA